MKCNRFWFWLINFNIMCLDVIWDRIRHLSKLTLNLPILRYVKFNHDLYKNRLPNIGDVIVVKKEFITSYTYLILKGTEWRIENIRIDYGDWEILLHNTKEHPITVQPRDTTIKYFGTRRCWETKSNIRDNKLKEIGI